MGKWADKFQKVDERAAITFGSWDELNRWFDSCGTDGHSYRGSCCPLVEELFVIGCYQQYRKHELNDVAAGIYTSFTHTGENFEVLYEVEPWDNDFDLESLPMWVCRVGDEEIALFPEEIFANW